MSQAPNRSVLSRITAAAGKPDQPPITVDETWPDGRTRQRVGWQCWIDGPVVLRTVPDMSGRRPWHVFLETMSEVTLGGEQPQIDD